MKKVLYIDMDNVLVDFPSGIEKLKLLDPEAEQKYTHIWNEEKTNMKTFGMKRQLSFL
jgi:hypothetical protein